MRLSIFLLAACMTLSGCLAMGSSDTESRPQAQAAEPTTAAAGATQTNAADAPATAAMTQTAAEGGVTLPPVKPAVFRTNGDGAAEAQPATHATSAPAVMEQAPEKTTTGSALAKADVSAPDARKTKILKVSTPATATAKPANFKDPMLDRECYTVDLFTDVKVEAPPDGLPPRYVQYLGRWGKGAWNGVWCHDLLISRVYSDGQVELVDMHAPYEPWNQPAMAFRRVGWIDGEGRLHFNYGAEKATYRIVDGTMKGTRRVNGVGILKIEMSRRGKAPKYATEAMRLAAAAPEE